MIPEVYPFAHKIVTPLAMGVGKIVPRGVVVHYLADRNTDRAIGALKGAGLGYHLIIERDGTVVQTSYMTLAVNHAGEAAWQKASPNRHFLAVALASWGVLTPKDGKLLAWNGSQVGPHEAAQRPGNVNGTPYWWDIATNPQEKALKKFLTWVIERGIDPKMICGHDECALPKGRKPDPGGVLSQTMKALRSELGG